MRRTDKPAIDPTQINQFVNASRADSAGAQDNAEKASKKKVSREGEKEDTKSFLLRLPQSTYRAIKVEAAETDRPMQEIILDAINEYFHDLKTSKIK